MTMQDPRITVAEGDEVFGSDGDKVGNVIAANNDYVVVEKGWFFPTDYYIPLSAVSTYDDGKLYLNVTKDVALNQGWDQQPTYVDDRAATTAVSDPAYATDVDRDVIDRDIDTTARTTETEEDINIPVYEEELTATKTPRQVGGAHIEKDVVTEDRVLEVPVTEERVKVVRRSVDRDVNAADADHAFEEVVVDVPIEVEDVEVDKRTRVAEEIAIQKEAVQRKEQVQGTVRHEEVHVTDADDRTVARDRDREVNP